MVQFLTKLLLYEVLGYLLKLQTQRSKIVNMIRINESLQQIKW